MLGGAAAGLTVADDNGGKPIFRKWSPYDREETIPVASPMRETDRALARVPDAPQRILEALPATKTPGLAPDIAEATLSAIDAQNPLSHSVSQSPPANPSPAAEGIS